MRRIVSLLLIVGLLAALGGCAMIKPKPTPPEVRQQMLDYLAAKYDREFEVQSMNTRGFDTRDRDIMEAYPSGGNPADTFRVYRDGDTFDPVMSDGYVGYVMRDQYEALARPVVEAHFTEFRLQVGNPGEVDTFPADFTPDMPFEQFRAYMDDDRSVIFGVHVPWNDLTADAEFQSIAQALEADIKALAGCGSIAVYGYTPDDFQTYIVEDATRDFADHNDYPSQRSTHSYYGSWRP
ncbi:MAG: hypothetical protein LBK42_13395 [Propionibacteriaceae bacterium]|jgi:hypothetical protein|nr:hypothetical protein [Propionibacteriaceae bacterium]